MGIYTSLPRDDQYRYSAEMSETFAFYLTKECPSGMQAYQHYRRLCAERGHAYISQSTFFERLKEIDPMAKIACRSGYDEARRQSRRIMEEYEITDLFNEVQADALYASIALLNDDDFKYAGIPIIFSDIECASRVPLGVFVDGFNSSETSAAVIECHKHAFIPKTLDRQRYGLIHDCIVYGVPLLLRHDGGPAYTSRDALEFLHNANVSAIKNPTKTPWANCFVESFNRTIHQCFLRGLPGYLPPKKQGYVEFYRRAEKIATLTVIEFRVLFFRWVYDIYIRTEHSGLFGNTPLYKYIDECDRRLRVPETLQNIEWVRSAGGNRARRTIQDHKGIEFRKRWYQSPELMNLCRQLKHRHMSLDVDIYYFTPPSDVTLLKVANPLKPGTFIFAQYQRAVHGADKNNDCEILEHAAGEEHLELLSRMSSEEILIKAKERRKKIDKGLKPSRLRKTQPALDISKLTLEKGMDIVYGKTRIDPIVPNGITPASDHQRDDFHSLYENEPDTDDDLSEDDFSDPV